MKIRILIGIAALTVLLGCGKLTMANYDRIAVGMSYDEVVALIGKPDQCDDVMSLRNCRWGDDKGSVNVSFAGDKVLLFSSRNLR